MNILALVLAQLAAASSPGTTAGGLSSGETDANGVRAETAVPGAPTTAGRLEIGQCEPPGLPHAYVSPEQRQETKHRVRAACKALGAAPIICAWVSLSALRESSNRPGVRHNRGPNEDGIGVLGLDKHSQRSRWPGPVEPAWCTPEASVVVVLAIARSAMRKWGATSVSDLQAVFAFRTFRDEDGKLHVRKSWKADERLCRGMMVRGFGCRTPVTLEDLGRHTPVADRPARARELVELFEGGG